MNCAHGHRGRGRPGAQISQRRREGRYTPPSSLRSSTSRRSRVVLAASGRSASATPACSRSSPRADGRRRRPTLAAHFDAAGSPRPDFDVRADDLHHQGAMLGRPAPPPCKRSSSIRPHVIRLRTCRTPALMRTAQATQPRHRPSSIDDETVLAVEGAWIKLMATTPCSRVVLDGEHDAIRHGEVLARAARGARSSMSDMVGGSSITVSQASITASCRRCRTGTPTQRGFVVALSPCPGPGGFDRRGEGGGELRAPVLERRERGRSGSGLARSAAEPGGRDRGHTVGVGGARELHNGPDP